jgi:hypothetical protein
MQMNYLSYRGPTTVPLFAIANNVISIIAGNRMSSSSASIARVIDKLSAQAAPELRLAFIYRLVCVVYD